MHRSKNIKLLPTKQIPLETSLSHREKIEFESWRKILIPRRIYDSRIKRKEERKIMEGTKSDNLHANGVQLY